MFPPHRYYYLHNFQRALAWVAERYDDVLDEPQRRFVADYAALPQPSQALLARLLLRRGPWFRASGLNYEEIGPAEAAAAPLEALGWLDRDAAMTPDELFGLHTKPELLRLFPHLPASARKAELLDALRARQPDAKPYRDWHPDAGEAVWRLMAGEVCERFRLMFFGNLHQDWSEFVLADLGVFQYESVPFDAASRAFQSRADVDRYLALHACRAALDETPLATTGARLDALLAQVQACASANRWLEQRRAKVLLRIGQACERAGDWPAAERVYAQCAYPGARHRRIRVHERMTLLPEALALAEQALAAPESEEEAQRVARMLPRLRRALGQPRPPAAGLRAAPRRDLVLPRPADGLPVELAVRDHWHRDEAPAHYVENTLFNALFGLLCWPAVFAPVPGAFFHPFQRGPADLGAPDFPARRAAQFQACLALLDTPEYRDEIGRRYRDKQGLQSPFVSWDALSEPLLALALDCVPAAHLKRVFERLLSDVKTNRSGLPDLIRFWPAEKRYELVEVKGPGDKLQDNQIRWLDYCLSHGMPVSVCHVRWQDMDAAPASQGEGR